MYLRGSKWNMAHRTRRRSGPRRIIVFLVFCTLAALYFDRFVIPSTTSSRVNGPTSNEYEG